MKTRIKVTTSGEAKATVVKEGDKVIITIEVKNGKDTGTRK